MTRGLAVAIALIVGGLVITAPGIVLLGVFALVTASVGTLWTRRGLMEVSYRRDLARDRAVYGDTVELVLTVANRKLLPLAWLRADDLVSDTMPVSDAVLLPSDRPGSAVLRSVWTLAPFQEVRRHLHLVASHRGLYRFETVRLSVADLFGRGVATRTEERPATFLVRPRTVPVRTQGSALAPLGTRRARRGLAEDPSRYAGIRPFQRGDPLRRLDQRAMARTGRPVSKRFESSTARQAVVAFDVQTHEGPSWLLAYDEALLEAVIVAGASLARQLLLDGAACGVAVNGWTYSLARSGFVAPSTGRDQLARITDLLGRTSPVASIPFARLLLELPARLAPGSLVVTVSGRPMASQTAALRRLRGGGFDVRHLALGPAARTDAAALRHAGIQAWSGRLDPDWQTSDVLAITG